MGERAIHPEWPMACSNCGGPVRVPSCPPDRRFRCPACKEWAYVEPARAATKTDRQVGWLRRLLRFLRFSGPRPFDRIARRPAADVREIPLSQIALQETIPRLSLDRAAQAVLDRSVARFGVLLPLVVRPLPSGFELVTGHRRLLAARRAGHSHVPAVVLPFTRADAELYRYLENTSFDPPTPIEEAEGFERLFLMDPRIDVESVCEQIGRDPNWLHSRLELLSAPSVIKEALAARTIDLAQARVLLRLRKPAEMAAWIEKFSREEATTRDLMEYLAGEFEGDPDPRRDDSDALIDTLGEALDEHLG